MARDHRMNLSYLLSPPQIEPRPHSAPTELIPPMPFGTPNYDNWINPEDQLNHNSPSFPTPPRGNISRDHNRNNIITTTTLSRTTHNHRTVHSLPNSPAYTRPREEANISNPNHLPSNTTFNGTTINNYTPNGYNTPTGPNNQRRERYDLELKLKICAPLAKRRRVTSSQREALEDAFRKNAYPSWTEKEALGVSLNMETQSVQSWCVCCVVLFGGFLITLNQVSA